jgi:hypothetical protein
MRDLSFLDTSKLPRRLAPVDSRRDLVWSFIAGLVVVVIAGGWYWSTAFISAPSRAEAEQIVFGNDLVAYETWDDRPRVVFRHDGKLIYDYLWADPISIEFPPTPRWQLSGQWSSMPLTSEPASVAVVSTQPTVLFGELDPTREIVAFEVQYDGAWHRFEVSSAGYLVRLDGFTGVPDAYRWLDAAGAAVWASGRVEPLVHRLRARENSSSVTSQALRPPLPSRERVGVRGSVRIHQGPESIEVRARPSTGSGRTGLLP